MGTVSSYMCGNCGYVGQLSEGPSYIPLTNWTTKVCNKDKVFVKVDTGFIEARPMNKGRELSHEEIKKVESDFNKCPNHHDSDISDVKLVHHEVEAENPLDGFFDKKTFDVKDDVFCPKCDQIMTLSDSLVTDLEGRCCL